MKLEQSRTPYISHGISTRNVMLNVVISLVILYGMAFFYYGPRVALLAGVGVVTAIVVDTICILMFGGKPSIYDFSPIITGMIVPLLLPATIPLYVVIVAIIFGILVAKHPFGGLGYNVFNPAAAGYAFVVTCYPAEMLQRYPVPLEWVPVFAPETATVTTSTSFALNMGGVPKESILDLALGNTPGPMGATNLLVLVACLFFLLTRRTIKWQIPISFLATTSIIAFFFPRIPVSNIESVAYEMMSGLVFFGAVFMLTDPVTTPRRTWARVAYGVVCGIIVMLFRQVGKVGQPFVFALLTMNAFVWMFDMIFERIAKQLRRRKYEIISDQEV